MGIHKLPLQVYVCMVVSVLLFKAVCDGDRVVKVKFLKAPRAFSHLNTATFVFQVLVGESSNSSSCTDCSVTCKLDGNSESSCGDRKVIYSGLPDGNHSFEVFINGSQGGLDCYAYNWTVDTFPPTAYVTASTGFVNAANVSVNVSFSEPCLGLGGDGGFGCLSLNTCNLLVYGPGQVIPSSLTVLEPNLKYSLVVGLSTSDTYGRVILVMDKDFCADAAGNRFTRSTNSSYFVHFDRRSVFVDLRTHVPKKLLQLNNETKTVQATNHYDDLKVYLYFSKPIVNSSAQLLNTINTSDGAFLPIDGDTLGNRRFGYQLTNLSNVAIVSVNLLSSAIISRYWTSVSQTAPVTFLYDAQRPSVELHTTTYTRTREHKIPVLIRFTKPVFGFNSTFMSISGGHLQRFQEITRRKYIAEIQVEGDDVVYISIPQNVTTDVAGNKNLPSNVLQVRHYSVPFISSAISTFATACFFATSVVAGLLTLSTSSLQSVGAFSSSSVSRTSEPTRNLFRIASHIQVFALSRWLAVMLPVEYYELARGLQWSIPYFNLPWESTDNHPYMVASNSSEGAYSFISRVHGDQLHKNIQAEGESLNVASPVNGLPLTPMEYRSFFESQNMEPIAQGIIDPSHSNGWKDFDRSLFWLSVIGGSLILLHVLLLLILKFRKKSSVKHRGYGALTFPRFEIFLVILALPCLCKASAALVRGGTISGIVTTSLLLGVVGLFLVALLLFLTVGITLGKLLQYKEVHQVGQGFHWYQELIRVTLGPGKRGQWTWNDEPNCVNRIRLGPLFEDLRGPPKYMLSQISGSNLRQQRNRIIASDDETEDAEAPFIQKLFGILRIYYTLLELVRRVTLGILAGAYAEKWLSKSPTIILLSMTSFQLFFIVLKKPFIKKKVQLVEIISIACQVGLFATCFVLLEKEFSTKGETKIGIFMIVLFLISFIAQMILEWYALYKQIKRLDPGDKSILTGFKLAMIGFLVLFFPQTVSRFLERTLSRNQQGEKDTTTGGETGSSTDKNRSSGSRSSGLTTDKPWLKQLREIARASFTREGSGPSDPSTSRVKWSGFWTSKKSSSSSQPSSSDSKSKPKQLYKDLEAIFASK